MAKITITEAIKRVYTEDEANCPSQHPWLTPDCLPIPRLDPLKPNDWTVAECEHVSSCRYCQMTIGLAWRDICPEQSYLEGYAAAGDNFCFRQAMEFHLQHDECEECLNALAELRDA